jgi:chromosome segregation ATPase
MPENLSLDLNRLTSEHEHLSFDLQDLRFMPENLSLDLNHLTLNLDRSSLNLKTLSFDLQLLSLKLKTLTSEHDDLTFRLERSSLDLNLSLRILVGFCCGGNRIRRNRCFVLNTSTKESKER